MTETIKLRVEALSKIFGREPKTALQQVKNGRSREEILTETGHVIAISDVSFAVKPGEIFVVMGLSGSGKSTLIRCLNRLIDPTEGSIFIDGEDITKADDERLRQIRLTKVSMVFQHFALFPHKTVAENVEFGLKLRGMSRDERRRRARDVLDQVGLGAWGDKQPRKLSGGMQQRVGLARSLAVDPEILLMDEAFSALDPLIRRDMQEELLGMQRRMRKTIVFITHDLHEALILGDRIAIMRDGRFVQIGTPQEIVAAPTDDYVAEFTRDVDRGRVFTAEHIMVPAEPLRESERDPETAIERSAQAGRKYVFVVDDQGRPLGIVATPSITPRAHDGGLERAFSVVAKQTSLEELCDKCTDDLPIAVVDEQRMLVGIVNPADILRKIGKS